MKKRYSRQWKSWMIALTVTLGLLALGQAVAAPASGVVGDWNGAISADGSSLRVVVHLIQEKDGKLGGTLDSPDQGATGIAISSVTYKDACN